MQGSVSSRSPALAFVTEGYLDQLVGIGCILNVLKSHSLIHPFNQRVWIVTPAPAASNVRKFITEGCGELDIHFADSETRADDKYYVQLGLSKVFEEADGSEALLSLDYDHLMLNPSAFRLTTQGSEIVVSSETQETVAVRTDVNAQQVDLPRRHINVSLIYGRAFELRKIGKLWAQSYEYLRSFVPQRNRTEVAFSLAAERANVSVRPCSQAFQGNFAVPTLDCSLFHYGGETHGSKLMKSRLAEWADIYRGRVIKSHDLLVTHELLVRELNSLLRRVRW